MMENHDFTRDQKSRQQRGTTQGQILLKFVFFEISCRSYT